MAANSKHLPFVNAGLTINYIVLSIQLCYFLYFVLMCADKNYCAFAGFYCLAFWMLFSCCTRKTETGTGVSPKHFLIEIPFQTDNRGIIITTHWGTGKKEYRLYLDNHSPSWVNDAVLRNNTATSKSKDFAYSTSTADGKILQGDVYMCDSVNIGGLSFTGVPFYNISNESNNGKIDGAVGESIMEHGIWKIDFKNKRIAIASDIDSIKGMKGATRLPAFFTDKAIEIEIIFSNGNQQRVGLDLGFNGDLILPATSFMLAIAPGKKTFMEKRNFSTPAGSSVVDDRTTRDRVQAGQQYFETLVSSNKLVKEKLIGLLFFKQFEFMVIDYINKAVYLSQKRMPA